MGSPHSKIALLILVVTTLFIHPELLAQTWLFQGSQICFQNVGMSTCFSQATIQSVARNSGQDQFWRSYQAGRELGQGVGSLVSVLISAWSAHRQKVQLENAELRGQLEAYFEAELNVLKDLKGMAVRQSDLAAQLEKLDIAGADAWEQDRVEALQISKEWGDSVGSINDLQNRCLKGNTRTLRFCLDSPTGVRYRYRNLSRTAERAYVHVESLTVLAAHLRYQQERRNDQLTIPLALPK